MDGRSRMKVCGGTFNLASRPTIGFYRISVTNGTLSGDPY